MIKITLSTIIKLPLIMIHSMLHFNTITYIEHSYAATTNYKNHTNQCIKKLNQLFDAHSQCLIQTQQQLSDNQHDIDILQGNIQEIQHHISKIIKNQKELNNQLQQILHQKSNICCNNDKKSSTAINSIEKIIENPQTSNKITTNNNDHEYSEYKKAVSLVLEKKQYNQAIETFQNFVKKYPKSNYQPNAHYWLGQLYYSQKNKDNAIHHFVIVVQDYPQSIKASDALLKIGIIMQETEQKDKAKIIYKQIGKLYPDSDAAKQAQKRLVHLQ